MEESGVRSLLCGSVLCLSLHVVVELSLSSLVELRDKKQNPIIFPSLEGEKSSI